MGLQDTINYALFTNPISANTIEISRAAASSVANLVGLKPKVEVIKMVEQKPLWKLANGNGPFIRVAALSGAAAVMLGAYGSHKAYPGDEKGQERKRVFDTASRYHFIHTLAMLGLPMCRMPYLAGAFMVSGILLFCGTCYYYAFTGNKTYSKLTPLGGTCFILGWLGMLI